MAVQTIYTGKGLKAPQDKGHVMQALNQFSSQEQYRKTEQLNKGMKDRDDFLAMIKTDPVYLASTAANKKIAEASQGHIDKWTKIYKGSKGNLSTTDLADLQQDRGVMMAMQQFYTGINKEMMEAQKAMIQNPDKYDEQHFAEAVQQFSEKGVRDDAGFLMPAIEDPFQVAREMTNAQKFQYKDIPIDVQTLPGNKEERTFQRKWIDTGGMNENDWIGRTASTSKQQYNILGTFERGVDPETQKPYLEQANGDKVAAANLWYRDKLKGSFFQEPTWTSEHSKTSPTSPEQKTNEKTYLSGNTQYVDGKEVFTKGRVYGAKIAKDGADGITFRNATPMSVPAAHLGLDKELGLPSDTRVWVKPVISSEGEVEFNIEPKEAGFYEITVEEYGRIPKDQRKKYERSDNDDGSSTYKYKERVPENITAVGDVEKVGHLLGPIFIERYNEWFPQKKETTKAKPEEKKDETSSRFSWENSPLNFRKKGAAPAPQSKMDKWSKNKR